MTIPKEKRNIKQVEVKTCEKQKPTNNLRNSPNRHIYKSLTLEYHENIQITVGFPLILKKKLQYSLGIVGQNMSKPLSPLHKLHEKPLPVPEVRFDPPPYDYDNGSKTDTFLEMRRSPYSVLKSNIGWKP